MQDQDQDAGFGPRDDPPHDTRAISSSHPDPGPHDFHRDLKEDPRNYRPSEVQRYPGEHPNSQFSDPPYENWNNLRQHQDPRNQRQLDPRDPNYRQHMDSQDPHQQDQRFDRHGDPRAGRYPDRDQRQPAEERLAAQQPSVAQSAERSWDPRSGPPFNHRDDKIRHQRYDPKNSRDSWNADRVWTSADMRNPRNHPDSKSPVSAVQQPDHNSNYPKDSMIRYPRGPGQEPERSSGGSWRGSVQGSSSPRDVDRQDSMSKVREWPQQNMRNPPEATSRLSPHSDRPSPDTNQRHDSNRSDRSAGSSRQAAHQRQPALDPRFSQPLQVDVSHSYAMPQQGLQSPSHENEAPLLTSSRDELSAPERPPLPVAYREQFVQDLAEAKTPRTKEEMLQSEEYSKWRHGQEKFFQYPESPPLRSQVIIFNFGPLAAVSPKCQNEITILGCFGMRDSEL